VSLYRQAGHARRRRRLVIAGLAALVVAIAVVVVLVSGSGGPPSAAERQAAARATAQNAENGLELLEIEYGQAVRGGRVAAPTEYQAAKADVQRARDALAKGAADLDAVDASAARRAAAALDRLRADVDRRVTAGALKADIAQARAALRAFTSTAGR
jgi:hypothetical protein